MKGVDVSIHNEDIDWYALRAAGIDFAIVRCTYGKAGVDENFQLNGLLIESFVKHAMLLKTFSCG